MIPEASQVRVTSAYGCELDYSNASCGYVMVKYTGPADYALINVYNDKESNTFKVLNSQDYTALPLSYGSGIYRIGFYEPFLDTEKDAIYPVLESELMVNLGDEFLPYLYPNQMVWFSEESAAVAFGGELLNTSMTDHEVIIAVYDYITEVIAPDYQLERQILDGTVTDRIVVDVDTIYSERSGVCLDYAVLMAAMLRSQQIPTKLVFGYANSGWHSWVSVYTPEDGWVSYDPTYAALVRNDNYLNYLFSFLVEDTTIAYKEVYVF